MQEVRVPRTLNGFAALLHKGVLFDMVIEVESREIQVHRVVLASASDALQAKFTAPCSDAAESPWRPGVGSAEAWTWIVRWVYGCDEPVPWELFVEILILADRFQVTELLHALRDLELGSKEVADALVPQLLRAMACPTALDKLASRVLPASSPAKLLELLQGQRLLEVPLENVALVVKHLPLVLHSTGESEGEEVEERLKLLGAICRAKAIQESFPECFVDAVRWELFPSQALKAGLAGDFEHFQHFRQAFGLPMPVLTSKMSLALVEALAKRCQHYEEQNRDLKAQLSQERPTQLTGPGIFAWMLEKNIPLHVNRSSVGTGSANGHEILKLDKKNFWTMNEQPAWIELKSDDVLINIHALGLQNGHSNTAHRCQSFVVEAARADAEDWVELLSFSDRPLTDQNEVFAVKASKRGLYSRFRIRMTGPNTTGHWNLCVSWFDIFGDLWLKDTVALCEALASGCHQ